MYLDFYGLTREPFQITPDPEFLFLSPSHKEALASVIYGVEQRRGFVAIVGEVGVGKTTLLRSFLEKANRERLKIIYVFHSNISFHALLKTIFLELGIAAVSGDVPDLVHRLHRVLIDEYRKGNPVVLVIDEAQNMPVETLENLRMLSNLETSTDKLLQIVLCGQPELEQLLNRKELRQFRQRIAVRAALSPLSREESLQYIRHRLSKSLRKDTRIFSAGALDRIVRKSKGIPRTINILCDNALITGYGYQERKVSSRTVKEIIADLEGKKKPAFSRWSAAAAAFFLLLAAGYGISRMNRNSPVDTVTVQLERPMSSSPEPRNPVVVQFENQDSPQASRDSTIRKPKEKFPQTRVIQKGENLTKLVEDVYGFSNREILHRVQRQNQGIQDINKIPTGKKIVFPALEE